MTPQACQRLSSLLSGVLALGINLALWTLCTAGAAWEFTPWAGGPTPPLALTDQQGVHHTLTAYQGRVVLVNFWATWCAPCREEMPALQQLQDTLGKDRLVVLAVNYGESSEKVQEFLRQVSVDFPVLLDRHTDAATAWQIRMLPSSFVLGTDGKIRYSTMGAPDWGDARLVKLLTTLQ